MDSKNIYISSNRYLRKVTWTSHGPAKESEWIHFGINADLKADLLQSTIDKLFGDSTVYFITDRHTSLALPSSKVAQEIADKVAGAHKGLLVWDQQFSKVLEIGPTGVMRFGERTVPGSLVNSFLDKIKSLFS